MKGRPISSLLRVLGRPEHRFKLWMAGLVLVGLPLVGFLLMGFVVGWLYWASGDADETIPKDRAKQEVASGLKDMYGIRLDPLAEVVEAHRTSGGMQGDGTNWYLFQLSPDPAHRFEAHFPAHARFKLLTLEQARWIDPSITNPLGRKAKPPPDARIYSLDDRYGAYAIFFDDKFFYRFNHF